jgi:hypothetical protein
MTPDERRSRAKDPNSSGALLMALAEFEPDAVLTNPSFSLLETSVEWHWDDLSPPAFEALGSAIFFPPRVAEWLRDEGLAAPPDPTQHKHRAHGAWGVVRNRRLPAALREEVYFAYGESLEARGARRDPDVAALDAVALLGRPDDDLAPADLERLWQLGGHAHAVLAAHPDCPHRWAMALLTSPRPHVRAAAAERPEVQAVALACLDLGADLTVARRLLWSARTPAAHLRALTERVPGWAAALVDPADPLGTRAAAARRADQIRALLAAPR